MPSSSGSIPSSWWCPRGFCTLAKTVCSYISTEAWTYARVTNLRSVLDAMGVAHMIEEPDQY